MAITARRQMRYDSRVAWKAHERRSPWASDRCPPVGRKASGEGAAGGMPNARAVRWRVAAGALSLFLAGCALGLPESDDSYSSPGFGGGSGGYRTGGGATPVSTSVSATGAS